MVSKRSSTRVKRDTKVKPTESEESESIGPVKPVDSEIQVEKGYREVFISMASEKVLPKPVEELDSESLAGSVRRPTVLQKSVVRIPKTAPSKSKPTKASDMVDMVSLRGGRVHISGIASGREYLFERGKSVPVDPRDVEDLEGKRRSAATLSGGELRVFKRA